MGKKNIEISKDEQPVFPKVKSYSVTTDNDFNHLHEVFLEVQLIEPGLFKQ